MASQRPRESKYFNDGVGAGAPLPPQFCFFEVVEVSTISPGTTLANTASTSSRPPESSLQRINGCAAGRRDFSRQLAIEERREREASPRVSDYLDESGHLVIQFQISAY